jgi:hypothetical protein
MIAHISASFFVGILIQVSINHANTVCISASILWSKVNLFIADFLSPVRGKLMFRIHPPYNSVSPWFSRWSVENNLEIPVTSDISSMNLQGIGWFQTHNSFWDCAPTSNGFLSVSFDYSWCRVPCYSSTLKADIRVFCRVPRRICTCNIHPHTDAKCTASFLSLGKGSPTSWTQREHM